MQGTQEMQLQSLGWEDSLEEEIATHSSILAWRIPMDRGGYWAIAHRVAKSWTRLNDLALRAMLTVSTSVRTRNPPEIIMNPNCSYCWLLFLLWRHGF